MCKLKMIGLIIIVEILSFLIASKGTDLFSWTMFWLLIGTSLAAAGSFVYNQIIEADVDKKMERTKNRPLPTRKISTHQAVIAASIATLVGLALLYSFVNPLSSLLTATLTFSYVAIYTPLKAISWTSTSAGAISGAIPPLLA